MRRLKVFNEPLLSKYGEGSPTQNRTETFQRTDTFANFDNRRAGRRRYRLSLITTDLKKILAVSSSNLSYRPRFHSMSCVCVKQDVFRPPPSLPRSLPSPREEAPPRSVGGLSLENTQNRRSRSRLAVERKYQTSHTPSLLPRPRWMLLLLLLLLTPLSHSVI